MSNNTQNPPVEKRKVECGYFGHGTYSKLAEECYNDLQRLFHFNDEQAHVTAAQFAIDLGQAFRDMRADGIKLGKTGAKDKMQSFRPTIEAVKQLATYASEARYVTMQLDKLRKESGLIVHKVELKESVMTLVNEHASRIIAMTEDEVSAEVKARDRAK